MQNRQRFAINPLLWPLRLHKYCGTLIMSLLLGGTIAGAQPSGSTLLTFKKERISLLNGRSYYLLDVIDKRTTKANALGEIIVFGKPSSLYTSGTLATELFEYWSHSLKLREEDSLPLEITLDEISVNEKRIAPNKVSGEIRVKVSFGWRRGGIPLFLTGYQSGSTYTRPEGPFDPEEIVSKLLDGALKHFDKWIGLHEGKNPLLARGITLKFVESAFSEAGDTVFYSPHRKLTWYDFQGNTNRPGSRYAAAVFASMSYEGSSKMAGKYLEATISMKVFMVKSMSWGRTEARNTYTLNHEQRHFDIARIVAERFKEKLKKMDLTIEDYDSQIQYEFLESFREMNKEQEAYDGQTRHGLDTSRQTHWDHTIQAELDRIYKGS